MADVLPYLRNTSGGLNAQVLYPFVRTTSCLTSIRTFQNGSEQRAVERPPLYSFSLPMSNLQSMDKSAWLAFFSSSGVMGRAGFDLQLSLGATTYSNLTLLSDALEVTVRRDLIFDQKVTLRQVRASNFSSYTPPSVGSTFPCLELATGSATPYNSELPFVQVPTFLTTVGDNPFGPRFEYSWYGAGLTNFPTGYLRGWKLTYPLVDTTDLGILENYFLGQQGRYGSFTFVDPLDGISYSHVRFDMDEMNIQYITVNQYSTELTLVQTFNS